MRQIVLDTETTGLDPKEGHRVIEIGAIELIDRRITDQTFHVYINPEREIDDGAIAIHGITNEFLVDKPIFKEILSSFVEFIGDTELIIHNAPFDLGFLNYEYRRCRQKGKIQDQCSIIDTLALARSLHPRQKNNLDALCKRYNIDNSLRNVHGALMDAGLLARVYLAMTGGQGSLFGGVELQEREEQHDLKSEGELQQQSLVSLKVIRANTTEVDAHEQYLQAMQKAGKCLWTA